MSSTPRYITLTDDNQILAEATIRSATHRPAIHADLHVDAGHLPSEPEPDGSRIAGRWVAERRLTAALTAACQPRTAVRNARAERGQCPVRPTTRVPHEAADATAKPRKLRSQSRKLGTV